MIELSEAHYGANIVGICSLVDRSLTQSSSFMGYEYKSLLKKMPKTVDWSKLTEYEKSDMTIASHELACSAGFCEIQ